MKSLQDILKKKSTKKLNLKSPKRNTFDKSENQWGLRQFYIRYWASNSCVDLKALSYSCSQQKRLRQKLPVREPQECLHKLHQIISYNLIWKDSSFDLVIFDLSHVNEALIQHKSKPVHGIIGADVLLKGKAIVDYANYFCIYSKTLLFKDLNFINKSTSTLTS
jgi:hypothetical protein